MRYLRRTSNYLKRIVLFNITLMMNMTDLVAVDAETRRIDSMCSFRKEIIKLVRMNP